MADKQDNIKIEPDFPEAYNLFHQTIQTFSNMEMNGVRIDLKHCKNEYKRLGDEIKELKKSIQDTEEIKFWKKKYGKDFNLESNKQLADIFFNEFEVEPRKLTDKGNPATDKEALLDLEKAGFESITNILKMRKFEKLRNTYLKGIIQETTPDGFLHPVYGLNIARTFRGNAQSPNTQNAPKRDKESMKIVRSAFIPRKGHHLISNDFGGIEVKAACVVGSTKIETIDGPQTIKKVIRRTKRGHNVYVYGYSHKKGRLAVTKVTGGGLTRKHTPVYKVTLDNNKSLIVTEDHKFLLRNGEYKELGEVVIGESLMPFYKTIRKTNYKVNYENLYLNNGQRMDAHNLISEDVFGITIAGTNKVCHHKDRNGCNNSKYNLKPMDRKEHMRIHSVQGWKDNRKAHIESMHERSEKSRKKAIEINEKRKQEWTEKQWDEFGKRVSEGIKRKGGRIGENSVMFGKKHTPDTISKMSKIRKNNPTNPGWSKGLTKETHPGLRTISEKLKGHIPHNKGKVMGPLKEETKQKISEGLKGKVVSNETRKKIGEIKKKWWKDREKAQCPICKKWFKALTNTHLKNKHNMTTEDLKNGLNHKIKSIEFFGYEDVYNINVEGMHNYATAAGVVIKNCWMHCDPVMLDYLFDETKDMHADMAMQCYLMDSIDKHNPNEKDIRYCGKNKFVFPQFYGDYWGSCAHALWHAIDDMKLKLKDGTPLRKHLKSKGVKSLKQFENHLKEVENDFWNNRFRVYQEWKDRQVEFYVENGYVSLLTGFKCTALMDKKQVINYPIQGVAAHTLFKSLIMMEEELKAKNMKSLLVLQIHDDLIADVPEKEVEDYIELSKYVMVERMKKEWKFINTPLEVDPEITPTGKSWVDAVDYHKEFIIERSI